MQILPLITHVAIKYNGTIHSLPQPNRHHHIIRMIGGIGGPSTEGFIDANGTFLKRKEAYKLACMNGQIKRQEGPNLYQGDELFSEDIW